MCSLTSIDMRALQDPFVIALYLQVDINKTPCVKISAYSQNNQKNS